MRKRREVQLLGRMQLSPNMVKNEFIARQSGANWITSVGTDYYGTVIDIILAAGHSALDVSLYTLLPIMVVMTIVLCLLEVYGVLK